MKRTKDSITKASIEAEERERHRIAKDIHDSLGQQLSAIKLYLNTLKKISPPGEKLKHNVLITKSIAALDDAVAELSDICFNLMPAALNAYGLIFAISELSGKIKLSKKINVDTVIYPKFPQLEKTLEINIYRVIQEFVNNSIKHGKAKNIKIKLDYQDKKKQIEMVLKDDGKGFDITKSYNGMGLKNARSRVEFHKGKLNIKSTSSGTTYEAQIPIKKDN